MSVTLSDREHAHLARELIEACGGPAEVQRVTGVTAGTLSRYSLDSYAETMPGRLINRLEVHCSRKIYSTALFQGVEPADDVGEIADIACDLTEAMANVQARIRRAMSDKRLTPREISDITKLEGEVKRGLADLDEALRSADAGAPALRSVS